MGKRQRDFDKENYTEASLNDWQHRFQEIYGEKNQNRRPENIWAQVTENLSKVAENLRRFKYAAAFQSLCHVLCWVCAFVNRTEKNLEDLVWKKYPFVCPYCLRVPCSCGAVRVKLEEAHTHVKETFIQEEVNRRYAEKFKEQRPSKLDDWVLMYAKLYGNTTYSMPVYQIGFHLMEEDGEVSRILRRKREFETRVEQRLEVGTDLEMARQEFERDLDSELADVYSWLCTLVYKLQTLSRALQDFQGHMNNLKGVSPSIKIVKPGAKPTEIPYDPPEATFSSVLFWEYGDGCPNCGCNPCSKTCFLRECKFMDKHGKCKFDWSSQKRCNYGKTQSQSEGCGLV